MLRQVSTFFAAGLGRLVRPRYIEDSVSERAWQPLSATLVARRDLAPDVVLLRFRMRDGDRLTWEPGQYLTLSTADVPDAAVPYSIASAPERAREGEFELAVSANGGQELLSRLHLGARVFVTSPQGGFVWEKRSGATLLIGMGTGLAPLRAMLQALLEEDTNDRVTLLFGARSEADILFRDELVELAERHARFSFEPTLSRPGSAWRGRTGRVQDHLSGVVAGLPDASAYICGSRAMVGDCVQRLIEEHGIDPSRIRSEAH
jgi:CDP-4-dehydro-6-deoxyglucose reductase